MLFMSLLHFVRRLWRCKQSQQPTARVVQSLTLHNCCRFMFSRALLLADTAKLSPDVKAVFVNQPNDTGDAIHERAAHCAQRMEMRGVAIGCGVVHSLTGRLCCCFLFSRALLLTGTAELSPDAM